MSRKSLDQRVIDYIRQRLTVMEHSFECHNRQFGKDCFLCEGSRLIAELAERITKKQNQDNKYQDNKYQGKRKNASTNNDSGERSGEGQETVQSDETDISAGVTHVDFPSSARAE